MESLHSSYITFGFLAMLIIGVGGGKISGVFTQACSHKESGCLSPTENSELPLSLARRPARSAHAFHLFHHQGNEVVVLLEILRRVEL